jgi:ankyrin repeat protein
LAQKIDDLLTPKRLLKFDQRLSLAWFSCIIRRIAMKTGSRFMSERIVTAHPSSSLLAEAPENTSPGQGQASSSKPFDCSVAQQVLAHRSSPKASGQLFSELTQACRAGRNDLVTLLLDCGFDPNTDHGEPLICSATLRNVEAVKLLLRHGALPNANGKFRINSALHEVARRDIDWYFEIPNNPVWQPVVEKHIYEQFADLYSQAEVQIISDLVTAGANPNNTLLGLETPLHAAVNSGSLETQAYLIKCGADLDIPDYRGMSVRTLLGIENVARMLVRANEMTWV